MYSCDHFLRLKHELAIQNNYGWRRFTLLKSKYPESLDIPLQQQRAAPEGWPGCAVCLWSASLGPPLFRLLTPDLSHITINTQLPFVKTQTLALSWHASWAAATWLATFVPRCLCRYLDILIPCASLFDKNKPVMGEMKVLPPALNSGAYEHNLTEIIIRWAETETFSLN